MTDKRKPGEDQHDNKPDNGSGRDTQAGRAPMQTKPDQALLQLFEKNRPADTTLAVGTAVAPKRAPERAIERAPERSQASGSKTISSSVPSSSTDFGRTLVSQKARLSVSLAGGAVAQLPLANGQAKAGARSWAARLMGPWSRLSPAQQRKAAIALPLLALALGLGFRYGPTLRESHSPASSGPAVEAYALPMNHAKKSLADAADKPSALQATATAGATDANAPGHDKNRDATSTAETSLLASAVEATHAGDYARALEHYRKLLAAHPENHAYQEVLAVLTPLVTADDE